MPMRKTKRQHLGQGLSYLNMFKMVDYHKDKIIKAYNRGTPVVNIAKRYKVFQDVVASRLEKWRKEYNE